MISDIQSLSKTFGEKRISVSFIALVTSSVILIPFWYLAGVDQFIWPFISISLFAILIWERSRASRGIYVSKLARVGFLFVVAQMISGIFIIEREFYIVFVRNILAWIGGILLLITLTNVIRVRLQILKLIWPWIHILLIASLVGLIAYISRNEFEIKTLVLYVVPSSMRNGITAQTVWTRSFLAETFYIAGQAWYRARSFFLYANSFAAILVLIIPLTVYMWQLHRKFSPRWWYLSVVLILSGINILATTSRAGILSLIAGFGVFIIARTTHRDKPLWMVPPILLIIAAMLLILMLPNFTNSIADSFLEGFVTAKGRSHITRLNILQYSYISWLERPVFGWGTPREMSIYGFSPAYPRLGSHSQLISVLYRHGIVGSLIFLGMLITLLRRFQKYPKGDWRRGFQPYLLWSVGGNLLHSVFIQLDIDYVLIFAVWQIWAIVDVTPNLQPTTQDELDQQNNGV